MVGLWAGMPPAWFGRLAEGLRLSGLASVAVALAATLALLLWRARGRSQAWRASRANLRPQAEFLAALGREIQVPLDGLFALAGMVARADLESRRQELTATIQKSSEALLAAANEVLTFSRSENDGTPVKTVAFDLRAMAEQAARLFAPRAWSHRLAFKTAIGARVPRWVMGDPSSLAVVLMNLLDNAVRFTREGVVRLDVSLLKDTFGRPSVKFTVSDTGAGMDAETLARLLEPEGEASSPAPQPYRTTGLGLGVSRRLIAKMGGSLGAESEPRGGSTFWFRVPVEIVEAAPAPPSKIARRSKPAAPPSVAPPRPLLPRAASLNRRILIVERDPAQQVAVLFAVRMLGYQGQVAAGRNEALEAWAGAPFDLVLLDGEAPGGEGLETAAAIRERETGARRIPIVALTAKEVSAEQQASWTSPIDDQLAKPLCLAALARVLERWLAPPVQDNVEDNAASSARLSLPV